MLSHYATPQQFSHLARRLSVWLWSLAGVSLVIGLWLAFNAPPDYQQGYAVRLLFVHVPSAWLSLGLYTVIAVASALGLIFRYALAHVLARAAVVPGVAFTFLTLLTGSLWGKPMWGVWWVWDARLTSVLILLFIYLGLLALWEAITDLLQAAKMTAILALTGFVNVPIVKFSVDWWNTLHQSASVSRLAAPALHADFLWPLGLMMLGFSALAAAVVLLRMQTELLRQRHWVQQRRQLAKTRP